MANKVKKKVVKIKKIPIIIAILVVFLVIGLLIHFNSKTYLYTKAYTKSLNDRLESYNEIKSKYYPFIDNNFFLETNTIFNYNEDKNKVDGKIYIDGSNNYFDLTLKQNDQESNISIINKDNKTYYKIKDEYYYINNTNNSTISEKELADIISKYFKKYIKKGTVTKGKEIIKYDKTYKTTKLTLKLSNKDFYQFLLDVLNDKQIKDISNNKKLVQTIKDRKNKEKTIDEYFEYSIYTYKGTTILEEFEIDGELEISIFNNENYKHIKIEKDKKESYIIIDNNKISLYYDGYFYGKGSITDNTVNIIFTNLAKKEVGSLSYKIENDDKKYTILFKMNISTDDLKINVDSTNKIDTNKSIPSIDLKGAKDITKASVEDVEILKELLSN